MQKRPQTSQHPTRPFSAVEGRPQTQHKSKRSHNTRSNQQLPPVHTRALKSATPRKPVQNQIRMAVPGSQQFDVSGKYWDIVSKQTEALLGNQAPGKQKRPLTAHPQTKGWMHATDDQVIGGIPQGSWREPTTNLQEYEQRLQEDAKSKTMGGPLQPKPFSFLSKLGGTQTVSLLKTSQEEQQEEEKVAETDQHELQGGQSIPIIKGPGIVNAEVEIDPDRKRLLTIFTNYNVDDFIHADKKQKTMRIASAKPCGQPGMLKPTETNPASRPISSYVRQGKNKPPIEPKPKGDEKGRPFSAFPNLAKGRLDKKSEKGEKVEKNEKVEKENDEYENLGIEEIVDNQETSKEYEIFQQVQDDTYARYYRRTAEELMKSRPTTSHLQKKEKEEEVAIFPDLFDRSERTKGATFAKYGDLSYSTPIQRIGRYMDYSAVLKRQHLIDTISYLKTSSAHLAMAGEKKMPVEYLDQCLFFGVMKEEQKKLQLQEVSSGEIEEIQYDPANIGLEELSEYAKPLNENLRREIEKCQKRYLYYVEKDEIRIEEISVYNKKWMVIALEKLGDESLLKVSEDHMREVYQEVISSYVSAMKRAIMIYILRCPLERKRLQITVLPRTVTPSNEIISYRGGYSTAKFSEWHRSRNEALQDIKLKLLTNNIVMSALQNWFQDFRAFKLLHLKNLKSSNEYAIDVDSFFDLQRNYRRKVKGIFQHIWHRGAIMILFQFKYLKKADMQCGKFTLKRYFSGTPQDFVHENLDYPYLDGVQTRCKTDRILEEEYSPDALIEDVIDVVEKEELLDIRESQAYINYVRFLKGTVNYNDDGYKALTKEYRTELKYCAGNLMCVQMRMVIERTIELIFKYFKRFETTSPIQIDTDPLQRIRKLRKEFSGVSPDSRRQKNRVEQPVYDGLDLLLAQVCSGKHITKPIWRIELEVQDGIVIVRETKEHIIEGMGQLIDKVVKTFNKFLRPEFSKLVFMERKKLEYEEKDIKKKERVFMQLHNDSGMQDDIMKLKDQRMYKKYCANFRVEESEKDEKLLEQDKDVKLFMNPLIKKKANIGNFMYASREKMSSRYMECKTHIQDLISTYYDEAIQILVIFTPFKPIVSGEILEDCKVFTQKENLVLEEYEQYITEINLVLKEIEKIPEVFFMTMFEIGCEKVLGYLKAVINNAKKILKERMEAVYIEQVKAITKSFKNAEGIIKREMKSPEDVQFIEAFKSSLILDLINWKEAAYKAQKILFKLMDIDLIPEEKTVKITKKLHFWPERIRKILEDVEDRHKAERTEQEHQLKEKRERFEARAGKYSLKIGEVETFGEIKDYQKFMEIITKRERKINQLDAERETINKHEQFLFGYASPFDVFANVKAVFTPHCELWKVIDQFHKYKTQWYASSISVLNPTEMESQVKQNIRALQKAQKVFDKKNHPQAYVVTEEFKREIEEVQKVVPTVDILSNPGLKKRHWEEIQVILTTEFDWKNVTLKDFISKGVEAQKEKITEISDLAAKEYTLEKSLAKMQEEWKKQEFTIIMKKDSHIKILSGGKLEEMQMMLDEHIILAQQIRANPFVKPMEEEANNWERKLITLRNVLDRLIKVQVNYLYLNPIFDSEDITKRLANEATKFSKVDVTWKDIMNHIEKDNQVLNVDKIPNLMLSLDNARRDLESIAVNLNSYLEDKRKRFPRFYFLANDDLYDILGDTRNPRKVENYLKKIFEGINRLIFSEDTEICGMKSPEGEEVLFTKKIRPQDYHGNVENMLLEVEYEMKNTITSQIEKAIEGYIATPERIDWVIKKWPAQIVLCVSQLFWCKKVTECIAKKNTSDLKNYLNTCAKHLEDIVNLVRGQLTNLQRITLGALTVLDVHSNDILDSLLSNDNLSETAFEWVSQLRYYYDAVNKAMELRMITTTINYGNEYLGNTSRLVITPLTDRCYRTMMSALKLNLGGAPEGPAGTGKTETVKDLSKAVAVKILVFNCSEKLDYRSMAKLFKGLASAGAWSCFDEFNRIEPEVLSVIAQQILAIQMAKTMELATFEFDGGFIELRSTCNVFITMNPGYVGRTELPDNLKALFRPAAMMVPDYAMIAEIRLYSTGFLQARAMAKKIVATYRLCSEQLSSQSHYDYGMRAVIAVLTAAAQLKQQYPEVNEEVLILRAIYDVNLPKFVANDIQLFKWIISDLFPSSSAEQGDYTVLLECINQALSKFKLQPVEKFLEKVLQLYETINCRHGLMIVGDTLTGKSAAYKVLAEAINILAARHRSSQDHNEIKEVNVEYYSMNPKAVPIDQLYGSLDRISLEWTEGVLAKTFRDCATHPNAGEFRQWIILDGPVDTLWIENLNTVLDDNKMLCLMNGDIISMPEKMSMMFEVSDLSKASLATVSRCGMIYMQNETIHWSSVLQSWLKEMGKTFDANLLKRVDLLFDGFVSQSFQYLQKRCHQYIKLNEMHLAMNVMKMYEGLLKGAEFIALCKDSKVRQEDLISRIDCYFLYSLIWAVGCNTNEAGNKRFSEFLRNFSSGSIQLDRLKDKPFRIEKAALLPESTLSLHSYYLDNCKWKIWREYLEKMDREDRPIDETLKFHEIVIPTIDTLKFQHLLSFMVSQKLPVLVFGPTGTGKTLYVNSFIKSLPVEKFVTCFVCFSAQTSASQVQDILETKLEPRKRGVFAPRYPKQLVVFVDDLNMPLVEYCGAQPPIELLRQFLDIGGWYSKDKERKMKHIEDTLLIAAMSPPGGGRNEITPRLIRHFNILTFNSFDDSTLQRIFSNLMTWHVKANRLPMEMSKSLGNVVSATIDVYNFVCEKLLHTPEKFHYLFNMRDLSRVMQGVIMANLKAISSRKLIRLFIHEISRVFFDRLVTEHDKQQLYLCLHKIVREKLREDLKPSLIEILPPDSKIDVASNHETLKYIVFSDVMSEGSSTYDRVYDEVSLAKPLYDKANYYLEEFNSNSKKQMNIVLFDFAVEHLLRILRILRLYKGNALLVGVGGSGRQSLTKLATFMCDFQLFDVEISKNYNKDTWREDMKTMLKYSGNDDKRQVFVLSDSQIKFDFILEDVNNLLNTGEIPNLWAHDEKLEISEKSRNVAKKDGKNDLFNSGTTENLYDFFVERCKLNMHIVMAMSPIGGSLRNRMRMFPSIVNCCSIDWFGRWPETGLRAVADKYLKESNIIEPELTQLVHLCTDMHVQVQVMSDTYLRDEKRYNYVTPTTYIELIQTYKLLLAKQRENIIKLKLGYTKGIEKLEYATKEVEIKQKELEEKEPVLIEMNAKTAELIAKVNRQITEVVEPKKKIVVEEELLATQQAQEAEQLLAECTQELAKFMPKLKDAQEKMRELKPKDINELKTYKDPVVQVKLVLEALAILKQVPITYTPNPSNPKEQEANMWATAKKMLAQVNFLSSLIGFDYNNIPLEVIEKIRKQYINDLNPTKLKTVSTAASILCYWLRAVEEYDKAYRIIKPKEQKANEAKASYKQKRENVKRIQDELQVVQATLDEMQHDLDEKQRKKAELEAQIQDCKVKIIRARALLEGLGGEKQRWAEAIEELQILIENVIGDMLVCAGVIAYLGAFPAKYRQPAVKKWLEMCQVSNINATKDFSLEKSLGEPVILHEWVLNNLPTDSFSKENALIATQSRRWPLLIDPEGQANRWIRNQYQDRNLSIVKLTDDYMNAFKKAIPFGEVLLLENLGLEMDPSLDPLLLKQTFKNSGIISIKIGDSIMDYSKDFAFFMTTKLRNPHYLPELSTKVTLINFALTYDGLKDQLLDLVIQKEKQELDDKRSKLIRQNYEYKRELKKREDNILEVLRSTQGNILDNEAAVNALKESQTAAVQLKEKQIIAAQTEADLEIVRAEYIPIAQHVAALYFIISNLGTINEMYQYSLTWYMHLFTYSIDNSEKSDYVEQRIEALKEHFTFYLFESVIRSLFAKDKLLFSFLMAACIQDTQGQMMMSKYKFLISQLDGQTNPLEISNPAKSWLSDIIWNNICCLANVAPTPFSKLPDSIRDDAKEWKKIFDNLVNQKSGSSPKKKPQSDTLPSPFNTIGHFDKLCLLKVFTPDKLINGVKDYVGNTIGSKFLYYPPFDLDKAFNDSSTSSPLIFVLPGTDPMATLRNYAQTKRKLETMKTVSLGQDQGPIAISYIDEAKKSGSWVVLQNCHLAPSFMPMLEKICDGFQVKVSKDQLHPSFRLWLTSYVTPHFPVVVLQNGIKLTNEPPKGTKANLLGSFKMDPVSNPDFFDNASSLFKRSLLGLCFFHSMIQERRAFGPLGWNIPYDFNQSDLYISIRQLHSLLQGVTNEKAEQAFKSLRYLICECNYGGRVTDGKDRKLIHALLHDFFSKSVLERGFSPSGLEDFMFPEADINYEQYCNYISKQLPDEQPAELFGFNENAFMSKNIKECSDLLTSMQKLGDNHFQNKKTAKISEEGRERKPSLAQEKKDEEMLYDILAKLPEKALDFEAVEKKYPPQYENSMNAVLTQEVIRFNILQQTIKNSITKIIGALKGEQLMSTELEEVSNAINLGLVPNTWKSKSYPSLKPLGSYLNDLRVRLTFFKDWVESASPKVYWISGFFFTQSFLTSTLQNYARKHKIEIDKLDFDFEFFHEDPTDYSLEIMSKEKCSLKPPEDGVLITGLYLEGGRWDYERKVLAESKPKILFTKAPIIWLKPKKSDNKKAENIYSCPVYKTLERRGILASTGHSTNYVMDIKLPIDCEEEHWIKRGVAMICQLNT